MVKLKDLTPTQQTEVNNMLQHKGLTESDVNILVSKTGDNVTLELKNQNRFIKVIM